MTDVLLESLDGGVATLTLNRPDRFNALSDELLERLYDALQRHAASPSTRVLMLTGSGRAFCAGGDVEGMQQGGEPSFEEAFDVLRRRMEIPRLLHEMPKPTIAMVNGVAAGAGFALAAACDLRVGSESARFTTAYARIGYSGDFGCSYFLTQLVGTAVARELFFTSEIVAAARAKEIGLLNALVPDGELAERAGELAQRIAKGSATAHRYMKRNLNAAVSGTLGELLDMETFGQIRTRGTDEHRQAVAEFMQKRKGQEAPSSS
ncbi:MAG: enoyl-CoA hydratase-related protein [Burkholderiaceae bacterium]